jgi:hypothetical protein
MSENSTPHILYGHRGTYGRRDDRAEHSEKLRLLLGMKRCFLRLHFLNELSDPFIRQLVRYADHEDAVVIDLLVEFGALVTHSSFRIGANSSPDWLISSQWWNCSQVHKENSGGAGKYTLLL